MVPDRRTSGIWHPEIMKGLKTIIIPDDLSFIIEVHVVIKHLEGNSFQNLFFCESGIMSTHSPSCFCFPFYVVSSFKLDISCYYPTVDFIHLLPISISL